MGSLLKFRREFDQYINLRPARLFDGVPSPPPRGRHRLHDRAREHRGRIFVGRRHDVRRHRARDRDAAVDLHASRHRARAEIRVRPRPAARAKRLTVATKSNGIAISMPWDARTAEMAERYPDIAVDKQHIDIPCARFVLQPDRFDVVVASNRSATSCRISGRPVRARSASRRRRT